MLLYFSVKRHLTQKHYSVNNHLPSKYISYKTYVQNIFFFQNFIFSFPICTQIYILKNVVSVIISGKKTHFLLSIELNFTVFIIFCFLFFRVARVQGSSSASTTPARGSRRSSTTFRTSTTGSSLISYHNLISSH